MKVVILAGGLGSRLSEETENRPKPMIEIGGKPILWHIMKIYSHFGFNEFIICCGYKGYIIKEYFTNYFLHQSDITIDLNSNEVKILDAHTEPWKITLVDTGLNTGTGGRIKRVEKYIGNEVFMLTYGDGLSNVNVKELLEFHIKERKIATITAVQPVGRFGAIEIGEDHEIISFREKPKGNGNWINGGFFVLSPGIFEYITEGDGTIWERKPLENLVRDHQLASYKHLGFWRPMDTLRDKVELEDIWQSGDCEWKLWE